MSDLAGREGRIACIGTGTIGHGWAILFARGGYRTRLYDSNPNALREAMAQIERIARKLAAHDLVPNAETILERIEAHAELPGAVADVCYVQESIVEDVAAKTELFRALDKLLDPSTLVGSSTSELRGSKFMGGLSGSARYLVVHPINPPYLIPLVELCPTPETAAASIAAVAALMRRLGQTPITLRREISGFVANRLQMAVINEALHLVGEGYCDARDVDLAVSQGLGLRWSFMGPFETGHLNSPGGYLEYVRKFEPLMRSLAAELSLNYPWTFELIKEIDKSCRGGLVAEDVADKQLVRDETLMKLRHGLRR